MKNTDYSKLIKKLDELYIEQNIHQYYGVCKWCGKSYNKKDMTTFKLKGLQKKDIVCVECVDKRKIKNQFISELEEMLINKKIIDKSRKASVILSKVYDCCDCRFRTEKEYYSKYYDFYGSCEKYKFCAKQEKIRKDNFLGVTPEESEYKRVNQIIKEALTDDFIEVKYILNKLKTKLKNYDASKQ